MNRKKRIVMLIALLMSVLIAVGSVVYKNFDLSQEVYASENMSSYIYSTNVPEEIEVLAEELDLPEDPDSICEIIIKTYYDCNTVDKSKKSIMTADFLNPNEYIFIQTYHDDCKRGKLLRSSTYAPGVGTMTISETVSATYSAKVKIPASVISAEVGFSVTGSVTVSDAQTVTIPEGEVCTINAYAKLDYYEYHVWEDDVWFDDDCGTVTASNPVGVIFVVSNE